jgi:hypothetical protein
MFHQSYIPKEARHPFERNQRRLGIISNARLVKHRDNIGTEFDDTCNSIEKISKRLYLVLEIL